MQIKLGGQELSAKSAYSPIFANGGGVNVSKGETEAKVLGITTEANVPSKDLYGNCTETFMEDKSWMNAKTLDDCFTRRGYNTLNVPINIDSIAQAIRDYGFVIFLVQGQNNGSWLSTTPVPPVNNQNLWGHFVCSCTPALIGVSKFIKFYQSWGNSVGEQGLQYFSEAYINSGYIVDCFTFTK
jgi:hypothetical protein